MADGTMRGHTSCCPNTVNLCSHNTVPLFPARPGGDNAINVLNVEKWQMKYTYVPVQGECKLKTIKFFDICRT